MMVGAIMRKLRRFFHVSGERTTDDDARKTVDQLRRKQKREDAMRRLDAMRADLNGAGDRWFLCPKRERTGDRNECGGDKEWK